MTELLLPFANSSLRVIAVDEVPPGGLHSRYRIVGFDTLGNPSNTLNGYEGTRYNQAEILFQVGEGSPNGVSEEALLAILLHRQASRKGAAGTFNSVPTLSAGSAEAPEA
jgi:hypothetical protein